jgi:hypothetical protein
MLLFYFAAWTDSGCLLGCSHEHKAVTSAVACISCAGGYVVAVENGVLRQLTDKEEAEFQYANYGIEPERRKAEAVVPMIPSKVLLN